MERIVVIGTGYVGLPLALLLAKAEKTVIAVDIDAQLVAAINDASLNLEEAALREMLQDPVVRQHLVARTKPDFGDAFVVSVPTPLDGRRKAADLSHVVAAVESIVPFLRAGNVVVLESTVPPLTTRNVVLPRLPSGVHLAHCPERILPGNVFHEIVHNDRVIGGIDPASARLAAEVYRPFLEGEMYLTDDLTAELCKLMENTHRDVNIALANEFSLVAEALDTDIEEARVLANHHPRVNILRPGIGVGGHCLPIDPWFLAEVAPDVTRLITTARQINDRMPERTAARIRRWIADSPAAKVLLVGLAYKAGTYDMRESPAYQVHDLLQADGYNVVACDPYVPGNLCGSLRGGISIHNPERIVILVPHPEILRELAALQPTLDRRGIRVLTYL